MKRMPGRYRFVWLGAFLSAFAGAAYPQLTLSPAPPVGSNFTVALAAGFTTKSYGGAVITATNGFAPIAWTITGALPPGLNFNANTPSQGTATITGTPTATGNFVFIVSVFDSQDQVASQSYSITVVTGLNITTPPALPNATVGTNYSVSFKATGGRPPYTWFIPSESTPGFRHSGFSAAARADAARGRA